MQGLYAAFGRQLREARKGAGLSQERLAQRVGLSRTTIVNIEKGRQHVSLHQLFLFADAVGCTPTTLIPPRVPGETLLPPKVVLDDETHAWVAQVLAGRNVIDGTSR